MTASIDIDQIRRETPGIRNGIHLAAAGSALMPTPVIEAIIGHTRLEAEIGGYSAYARQAKVLDGVYDLVARHINAKPREIAILENATTAWCHAFYALPLKSGARILTCEAEYAANYVALLQRAKRENLTVEVIASDSNGAVDLNALEAAIDGDVGLIAMTWIPTNGGLVNPAEEIGNLARKHGVPFLLDGCQAVGQLRVNVEKIGCDFFSATGRKFLRGPRGTGFLYMKEKWLETLEPAMIDHFGAPWIARDRYSLREDARRFETWENAYALRAGLACAFDYAERIGMEAIEARVTGLADTCRQMLAQIPGVQMRDLGTRHCGIVSFSIEGKEAPDLVAQMAEAGFTIGATPASSTRIDSERRALPSLLRIAPHYYNTETELAMAANQLSKLL